jgi:uncharacterized protein (TIGR02996 family)
MMTHADAFLQAILDAPRDDAPRLLFADWLEEYGDADRAEFIRIQVALAGRGPGLAPAGLWSRQKELLVRHDEEWSAPARVAAASCAFERGFIEEVEAEAGAFLDGAEELFRQTPVQRLRLHWERGAPFASSYIPRLADCASLNRLSHLDLSGNLLGSDGLQALLVAAPLTGLASLSLRECQIGDRGARALAQSPLLMQLEWLDLGDNEIGPGGVRALAEALDGRRLEGGQRRLRDLLLQGNPLGEAGRRAVLASRVLSRAAKLPPPERTRHGLQKR